MYRNILRVAIFLFVVLPLSGGVAILVMRGLLQPDNPDNQFVVWGIGAPMIIMALYGVVRIHGMKGIYRK